MLTVSFLVQMDSRTVSLNTVSSCPHLYFFNFKDNTVSCVFGSVLDI